MARTTLSTKGQLIIPKDVRERHGWEAGTELEVEDRGDAVILRGVDAVPSTRVEDVVGCLRHRGRPVSLAAMERAIAEGALGEE